MKKWHVAGLFLAAPVLLFFAGPRPSPDVSVDELDLPDDLDAYLKESESAFQDIWPGTEKKIVWADPERKQQTPVSLVYVHGFSASRQEVAPLCDTLAERLGANLFYARLSGHGRPGAALGDVTVRDWINDANEALEIGRRLGEEVILIGTSTGGTLTTWLTSRQDIRGIKASILISPNFAPRDKNARVALWPWGKQILRAAVGKLRKWEPANERQAQFWTTTYPIEAIVTMMSLVDVVDELSFEEITTPTLVVYSDHDEVISVDKIKERFPQFGAPIKNLVAVNDATGPSKHVIAGEIISPNTTMDVVEIIERFLARVEGAGAGGAALTAQAERVSSDTPSLTL